MNAQLRARWMWLLVGGAALGCLSSLDERHLDAEGEAGEGGGAGTATTAGKGGTTTNAGSGGATQGSGGASGTTAQGGSAGSGSGATGGNASAGTSGGGRGGDAGSSSGGAAAGTSGESGMAGAETGGGAGGGGSDPEGGSGGGAGIGGAMAGSAGIGGGNVGGGGNAGGGNAGSGGTAGSPSCGTSWAAGPRGYVTSPGASGCWRGHAFTGVGGNGSTISPSSFESCGQSCSLCVEGEVQGNAEYTAFALLGVYLNQLLDSETQNPVSPEGQSLTLSYTNPAGSLLRVQLEPTSGGIPWCYTLTGQGSVTIPYSSFRQSCWDVNGAAYAGEPIVSVSLVVPGGGPGTNNPYDVCLTGLSDSYTATQLR